MTGIDQDSTLRARVRTAVIWRSGSQIAAQMLVWCSTFIVIRLLEPSDYGLLAMTQVVTAFLMMLNGWSFAGALVRDGDISQHRVRQVLGLLLIVNGGLALIQFAAAPLVAAYYRQPTLASMLQVQALLYFTIPFIAVPMALRSRQIDFRSQAKVYFFASVLSAAAQLSAAFAGFGVWTLVVGPVVLYVGRAVGLAIATRWLVWPTLDLRGTGSVWHYGGVVILGDLLWFAYSQSDIALGGRVLPAHEIGLYSTALFLVQLLNAKFLPALNEVGFTAFARIQGDVRAVAWNFVKAVRLVMLVGLPFYFGLAAVARPFTDVLLGEKWTEAAPIIRLLALAMPMVTLQVLFAPATNALGRPGRAMTASVIGCLVMPGAYLVGLRYGVTGLALAWLLAFPLVTVATAAISIPVLGLTWLDLGRAIRPGLVAALLMAGLVVGADTIIPITTALPRLAMLVAIGIAAYAGLLKLLFPETVRELLALARR